MCTNPSLRSSPVHYAEILCVGNELLYGDIINTNAAYLSKRLGELGIRVTHQTVVGDDPAALKTALHHAFSGQDRQGVDLVILSGGLGPTYDDLTKETVAAYFGRDMYCHEPSLDAISAYFAKTGRTMAPNNVKQAMMPVGGVVLPNANGTAPGVALGDDAHTAILLPGPPFELKPMFEECVIPLLLPYCRYVLASHNIHLIGMGESDIEYRLKDLMSSENPSLAPYCSAGEVRLRVTAEAKDHTTAEALCDALIQNIYASSVAPYIYGMDIPNPETALLQRLSELGYTLGTAESCTGGLMGARLTAIPGASAVFMGGFMTYCNQVKIHTLGVDPATIDAVTEVSHEVAKQMADGARIALGCDVAISATGYAGPGGGTQQDPVGTVYIGIASPKGTTSLRLYYPRKSRDYIREAVCNKAFLSVLEILRES